MSSLSGASSPGRSERPRRGRWGTGPKVLTWIGAVVLGVALVAGGFGAWAFASMVPIGVVAADGAPGPKAIDGGSIPGEVTIEASTGQRIVVWEAVPTSSAFSLQRSDIAVQGGAGEVSVRAPSVSGSSSISGVQARTVAEFLVPGDGHYTVRVDAGAGGRFIVAEGDSFPVFFTGLFGTIVLWFIAIGGGIVGVGMLVPGIVWGMTRARRPVTS